MELRGVAMGSKRGRVGNEDVIVDLQGLERRRGHSCSASVVSGGVVTQAPDPQAQVLIEPLTLFVAAAVSGG